MPTWPINTTQHHMPGDASFLDVAPEPTEQAAARTSMPPRLSSRSSATRLPYRTAESTPEPGASQAPATASRLSPAMSEISVAAGRSSSPTGPGAPPSHGHPGLAPVPDDAFFDTNVGVRPRLRRNITQTSTAHRSEQALPAVPEQPTPAQPSPVIAPAPASPAKTQAPAQTTASQLRHPPSLPPVLQQVLLPQPPIGPQCQLFGFSYRSEPVEGEEDTWQIDMSYRVRVPQE